MWLLCLKLKEIVEFICAPEINLNDVAYLKVLLEEYVYLHKSIFPDHPLKPKHHYLLLMLLLKTSHNDKHKTSETYKGTDYTKGLVVVLVHIGDTLVFGKISLILIDDKQVHFVVLVHHSVLLIDPGVYYLCKSHNKYLYINADSLQDYYPLPVYNIMDLPVVCLHHSVCCLF